MDGRSRALALVFALTASPVALLGRPDPAAPTLAGRGGVGPSPACPLAGRVVDAAGAPVAGATVTAWPRAVPPWGTEEYEPPSAETLEDGRFRIEAVPDGSAMLIVEAPDRPFFALRGIEIPCPTAEGHAVGTLRLPPGGELSGRVVDGEGRPLAGATVEVPGISQRPGWLPKRYFWNAHATVRTDERGRFRFPGLAVGSRFSLQLLLDGFVQRSSDELEVRAGGTELPDLVLQRSGAIRVRVIDEETGRPVEEARIWRFREGAEEIKGGVFEVLETDAEGVARLGGLAPGSYRLQVSRPGFSIREEVGIGVRAGATTEATVVLAGAPRTDVEVSLRPAGAPLEGAEVLLTRSLGEPWYHGQGVLEAGGEPLILRDVPFGRYQLHVSHPAYPDSPHREVDVAPDARRFELAFEPPAGGWVRVVGRVVDPGGQPVPEARVRLSLPNHRARYETAADGAGRFTLEAVAPGTYVATVALPGSGPTEVPRAVEVAPPGPGEIVLALPRTISITGAVRGLPEPELVSVELFAHSPNEWGTSRLAGGYVEADGTYHLEGVTTGSWTIEATRPGAAARASLEVPEGAEALTGPDLVFPERYTVSGKVLYKGRSYPGVGVSLYQTGQLTPPRATKATTDRSGRFTLDPVSADTYDLTIDDPDWGQVYSEHLEVTGDLDRTFVLGAAMAFGEVLDAETGLPVPAASVLLAHLDVVFLVYHWAEFRVPLDPEARFEAGPLREGRWKLFASADGYLPTEVVIEIRGEDLEGVIVPLTPTDGQDLRP